MTAFRRAVLIALFAMPLLAFASRADRPTTAVLTFQENVFSTYIDTGTGKEIAFKAEPKYEGKKLSRGAIEIIPHRHPQQQPLRPIGYVLDETAGKLYIDLNMNGDLTDDGAIVKDKDSPSYFQNFKNVRFSIDKGGMRIPYGLSINFYGDRPHVSVNSGWSGDVTLNGRTWNLQISDHMEGDLKNIQLVFRRDEKGPPMLPDLACRQVFLEGRLYQLGFAFVASGDTVNVEAQLQPMDADLGRVHLTGTHVHRLVLNDMGGSMGAVFYDPPADFDLPAGDWKVQTLRLQSGNREFDLTDPYRLPNMLVKAGQTSELAYGAPLKNKVDFGNVVGSQVTLNYKLVDGVGHEYRSLSYGPNPPQFEVYKAGKKIDSGKFEYG